MMNDECGGGVAFFGITDAGKSIVQVNLRELNLTGTRDIYGLDDIRFATVPEPGSATLIVLGALACLGWRGRAMFVRGTSAADSPSPLAFWAEVRPPTGPAGP